MKKYQYVKCVNPDFKRFLLEEGHKFYVNQEHIGIEYDHETMTVNNFFFTLGLDFAKWLIKRSMV